MDTQQRAGEAVSAHAGVASFLLEWKLLAEQPRYRDIPIPDDHTEQRKLLRSLMNVRSPHPLPADFLAVQDNYLREELAQR